MKYTRFSITLLLGISIFHSNLINAQTQVALVNVDSIARLSQIYDLAEQWKEKTILPLEVECQEMLDSFHNELQEFYQIMNGCCGLRGEYCIEKADSLKEFETQLVLLDNFLKKLKAFSTQQIAFFVKAETLYHFHQLRAKRNIDYLTKEIPIFVNENSDGIIYLTQDLIESINNSKSLEKRWQLFTAQVEAEIPKLRQN